MSASSTTTNLGLPQFASSDIPTWDDINSAFLALDTFISSVAPKFSTATSYQKGDVVLYNGGLYKFNANHAVAQLTAGIVYHFKTSNGHRYINKYDLDAILADNSAQAQRVNELEQLNKEQNAEIDALYSRLSNCPVPSVPVYGKQNIFTCNNGGCGCGNGFAN